MEVFHDTATERHLPYGITQCYLLPDTSEHTRLNPSQTGQYSIYLPRRDGRLSWPSWLDSAPAGSRTSDLSITNQTPNHCTTKCLKRRYSNAMDYWINAEVSVTVSETCMRNSIEPSCVLLLIRFCDCRRKKGKQQNITTDENAVDWI